LALVCLLPVLIKPVWSQDLSPRAYLITPVRSNAVILTWAFYDGGINFNGIVPVTDANGTYNIPVFSVYHSFSFFGRSAISTCLCLTRLGTLPAM
jgi:hypothetical protein